LITSSGRYLQDHKQYILSIGEKAMTKKILIVDDDLDILKLLTVRFKAKDFSIITATDGQGALAKVKAEQPDLIILDVMIPPPNGYQVCRILKDDPQYKHIPVIMLTAKATESDQFWGLESGADAYVTKPYNGEELVGKVNNLIGKK